MNFSEYLKKKIFSESDDKADKIFVRSIATSIFALVVCIIIFSATSFAWFSDTASAGQQVIQSSNYSLSISAIGSNGEANFDISKDENQNEVFSLNGGQTYQFTVTSEGGRTGYIKLKIFEQEYVSEQIDSDMTFTFSLTFDENVDVTILERWGISSIADEERDIQNGASYTNMTKNN